MTDIIELLKQDHKEVKDLLKQLTADDEHEDCDELFEKLYASLKLHAQFEEDEVYPLLLKGESKDLALEAYEEHRQAITLLEAINDIDDDDETCPAKLTVLSEDLNHHIKEEENELLPQLKKAVTADVLKRLGESYQELKDEAAEESETDDDDEDENENGKSEEDGEGDDRDDMASKRKPSAPSKAESRSR